MTPAPRRATPRGAMLVVAAVIERDGRLLVGQRPAHKQHGGLWEFPGGKVEPGETPAAALARELHEELGLTDVEVGPELHRHTDPARPLTLLFLRVATAGDPAPLEHSALAWIDPTAPLSLPLAPADQAFVESVRR
jgi:8-oxo-dGTP diphosphatase